MQEVLVKLKGRKMKAYIKTVIAIGTMICMTSFVAEASTGLIKAESTKEYDNLEKMFLDIDADITEEDLLGMIEDKGLEYTVRSYWESTGYKIAFEKDAAKPKYDAPGDYLEVSFSKDDGSLMYADYSKEISTRIALYYVYGNYWDLGEDEPDNEYTGYYYYRAGEDKGGITIQYNNGYSTETGLHPVDSAEDAL